MGNKHSIESIEDLLKDPLSDNQTIYVINKWITEQYMVNPMVSPIAKEVVSLIIQFSKLTMEEKLHNISIPYDENESRKKRSVGTIMTSIKWEL